ncbi:hypothetical protein EMN47_11040 [Prolixibacteraceae bacterium JC049]|nr:hypothetical protein [Prolixibacteraceae bacterium JC049]
MPKHMGNPEYSWFLTSLGFIATVMLGAFSGQILASKQISKQEKLKKILILGTVLTIAGHLLTFHEPCIKKLWLTSFTLISGGYCTLLLALFFDIVDVAGYTKWTKPFVFLGRNALLVYMLFAYNRFINLSAISHKALFGLESVTGNWYPLLLHSAALCLLILIFRFLDKNKVYLKI